MPRAWIAGGNLSGYPRGRERLRRTLGFSTGFPGSSIALLEARPKLLHLVPEVGVLAELVLDLLDRVVHRRMIPAPKVLSDLHERRAEELFGRIQTGDEKQVRDGFAAWTEKMFELYRPARGV